MLDQHSIGSLLLESGRIGKEEYTESVRRSRELGKPLHEVLLLDGKISVDELVQALTLLMDITLLKEAVGMGMDGSIDHLKRAGLPLGSYLEQLSLLFKVGMLISSQKSLGSLVELLIREAPSVMNAERATIFLADMESGELFSHMGVGLHHDQIRIPWNTGIAGWVFTHGKPLNIADTYQDPRFNRDVDPRTGFTTKNVLCVPIQEPGGPTIGVFQVLNKRAGVFTATDEEILQILASQAARSMENALEWDHLKKDASSLRRENVDLRQALRKHGPLEQIVGSAKATREIRALIQKVAPTDTTVLIQGESGTGKELVAKAIHQLSLRADKTVITLNCAAIPSELIESELFGHRKGSFTGAIRDSEGVFRAADGGTLFLDEIEATSPAMQVKLLRAVQVGEIKPVGANVTQKVDVRLICATNQDLHTLMGEGRFREDLFYRINVFPITIPPLRERPDDVPVLVRTFLQKFSEQTGKAVREIDPAAMDLLMRYPWPGNVRELENEIERAHVLTGERSSISVRSLSPRITASVEKLIRDTPSTDPPSLKDAVEELEKRMIQSALRDCQGNRSLVAKRLGLSRQGLLNKINKYRLNDS